MKTRFDLETDINRLHALSDDLRLYGDLLIDSPLVYDNDRLYTVLHGLAELHDARMEMLSDTFNQVFELNEYAPEDVKELRKRTCPELDEAIRQQAWRGL